jgi:melibiose permease/lactose/raffinose/galactose permease
MVFYPAISRKIHRKKLMSIMMAMSTVGYVLMLVSGFVLSGSGLQFGVLTLGYMLSNFGQYGFYLVMMISIINTVEYNEYKHGTREEAIIASIRPFFTKMGSALVVVITSVSYMVFGVTNYTNQISDLESAAAGGLITEAEKLTRIEAVLSGIQGNQSAGLLLCMVVIPFTLMFISYLLYRKHYILDEEEYDRICRVIAERKQTV